jgi:RNA polymerase sigma factor (sigma-70 family)
MIVERVRRRSGGAFSFHDVEDITHKTLLRFVERWSSGEFQFSPDADERQRKLCIRSWVAQAVDYLIAESFRTRQVAQATESDLETVVVTEELTAECDTEIVKSMLDRLEERERAVVAERFLKSHSVGEVAQTLGLKRQQVRLIQHRALVKLRKLARVDGKQLQR